MKFYVDAYFVGQWGHENPQDPICANIRTELEVIFTNFSSVFGVKATNIYLSFYSKL